MKNAATTGQVCLCRNVIAVRESEGLDVDDLAHLLHRYLRLDDEMLQVSVRWRDCFHLIEQYNDEQVKPPESVYLLFVVPVRLFAELFQNFVAEFR